MTNIEKSIQRIFIAQNKTLEWLKERVDKGTISITAYKEICGEDYETD